MLAERVCEALALVTPTKALSIQPGSRNKVHKFNIEAQECLESFLECKDLTIIFEVRREFEQFCSKVLRSINNLETIDALTEADPGQDTHKFDALHTNLRGMIATCQRRIELCYEYYELKHVVLVAVEQELENVQDLLFQITEHKLSPNSRIKPDIGLLYNNLKERIGPLNASVEFLPMRIECYSIGAKRHFEDSVQTLQSELYTLKRRIRLFIIEFNSLEQLLKPDWWDPVLEVVSARPIFRSTVAKADSSTPPTSSIPVSNLRLKGQRRSLQPVPFVSRIPKPTEVKTKARPLSMDSAPDRFAIRGHRHTSSQWSNSSTTSQDSIPAPSEPSFSLLPAHSKPRIYEPGALLPDPHCSRPPSRLLRPTPVDLSRIRHFLNKENVFMGKNFEKQDQYLLSSISESPNRVSMIPKFSGSPAVRKHKRVSGVLEKPIR